MVAPPGEPGAAPGAPEVPGADVESATTCVAAVVAGGACALQAAADEAAGASSSGPGVHDISNQQFTARSAKTNHLQSLQSPQGCQVPDKDAMARSASTPKLTSLGHGYGKLLGAHS